MCARDAPTWKRRTMSKPHYYAIQFWLSRRLSRCLDGFNRPNVARSDVTEVTVAPVQRLPLAIFCGQAPGEAVNWVSAKYCEHAVVTDEQEASPTASPAAPATSWKSCQGTSGGGTGVRDHGVAGPRLTGSSSLMVTVGANTPIAVALAAWVVCPSTHDRFDHPPCHR